MIARPKINMQNPDCGNNRKNNNKISKCETNIKITATEYVSRELNQKLRNIEADQDQDLWIVSRKEGLQQRDHPRYKVEDNGQVNG